jgi:hypothetical protein
MKRGVGGVFDAAVAEHYLRQSDSNNLRASCRTPRSECTSRQAGSEATQGKDGGGDAEEHPSHSKARKKKKKMAEGGGGYLKTLRITGFKKKDQREGLT